MNSLCWLCKGRELRTVEADVLVFIAVDKHIHMKAEEGSGY